VNDEVNSLANSGCYYSTSFRIDSPLAETYAYHKIDRMGASFGFLEALEKLRLQGTEND
jgi:hypothetical protein